jgi:nitrate reductase delta subunit
MSEVVKQYTFKVLSLLLRYPEAEVIEELPLLRKAIEEEGLLGKKNMKALSLLFSHLFENDILTLQEQYVSLFDYNRRLSLHLFEHNCGESRNRGQSMVDLKEIYQKSDLDFQAAELPDYLPAYLEFLSCLDKKDSITHLNNIVSHLIVMAKRLQEKKSPYVYVFSALISLTTQKPDEKEIEKTLITGKKEELTLDEEWADEPVTFLGSDSPSEKGGLCHSVNNNSNK